MGIPSPAGVTASGLPAAGDQANAVISGKFSAVSPGRAFAFWGPMNLAVWASYNTALTTTAGSLTATVTSAGAIANGTAINSVNVPPGTTVGNIVGTTVTLAVPTITLYGSASQYAAQISGLASTAGLLGSTVTGPNIPASTTVVAIITAAVAATNNVPGIPGTVQLSAFPTGTPALSTPQAFDFALTGNAVTVTGADSAAIFTGAAITFSATLQIERSFDGAATWLPCNIGGGGMLAQYTAGTPISLSFGEPERNVLYRLNCLVYSSGTINYRISATGGAALSLAVDTLA